MPTIRFLAIACFLPLFLAAAALGEKPEATADGAGEEASKKPTLVYYYYDGWPMCDKITVIVNDLKKTHGTKLNFVTAKVGTGDSAEELKKAKLKRHGIIAKDETGKLVVAVEGHSYGKKKVEEVIAMLLPEAE